MLEAIIGFIISYIFVCIVLRKEGDVLNGYVIYTLSEKLQASFIIFLFGGYWIVLLVEYLLF